MTLVLVALAAIYLRGWWVLRRRHDQAAPAWGPPAYLGGLATIALALLSPIDTFGGWLFIAHMVQHELLVMAAPPLLLLANPLAAMLWALPSQARRRVGRWLVPDAGVRRAWRLTTWLPVAWLLYVATLWGWHHPAAYTASLRNDLVHDAQHVSFFLSAVAFWWPVVNPAPRLHGHIPYSFRIASLIAATAQNTGLAFLLTMTGRVFYTYYEDVPRLWGLSVLDDQVWGGAIMWVVNGMMYVVAVLVLIGRLIGREEVESRALGRVFRGLGA